MKKLTYKQAVEEAEQIWEWLCDNPDKAKEHFDKFDISNYQAFCPMCEWDSQKNKKCCEKCFLDKKELCWGGAGEAYEIYNDKIEENNFNDESYAARLAIYNACLDERLRIM